MFHRLKLFAAIVLAVGALGARADDKKPAEPFDDAAFVKMAAIDGMHEVALGKIGTEKATSADVKKLAETLVRDHHKANEELKAAAKAANISVPEKLDEKHQKHLDRFKDYKGDSFDRDFTKHLVADHTEAVVLFSRASKEAKNPQIRAFAAKTLPVIQGHLDRAAKLSK